MAKKKGQPRRVPRAADARMYGDGKPSETGDSTQPAAQAPTSAPRPVGARSASAPQSVRSVGATPRTSTGAGGSYARGGLNTIADYSYVKHDLRRLGIAAAAILGALVVLGIILP